MKRVVVLLSMLFLLLTSACSVLPGLTEIASTRVSDPLAGTPVVEWIDPTLGVVTATPPGPLEVVVTPEPVTPEPVKTEAVENNSGAPQHGLSAEQFDTALIEAIEAKDLGSLRGMMGPRFVLAYWRSEALDLTSEDALADMSQSVLASGASPAASTGIDTAALLQGADPLAFFAPDAVRAIYFDFVGAQGTDQALAIIARDPATGIRYWKAMLVAHGGFHLLDNDNGISELNQFSQDLVSAFTLQDLTALHGMMGDQFGFAKLDPATLEGSLNFVTKEEAIHELRWSVLGAGVDPVVMWNTDIPALLNGSDPLAQWGPTVSPLRAIHAVSLNSSNQGEGVLVIGREESGRLYWLGILLPLKGETFGASGGLEPVGDALPTEIHYVEAMDDLNVRSGPGMNFAVEGRVRKGEMPQVSGISADGNWWQIYCTQDASGRCWISADPELTRATYMP